jgi:arylsulfatase
LAAKRRRHLVFICVDQMRYDALSSSGNTAIETAHLDRIARRGMVFHRHHTPNQICSPSRATMATGLYPRTHGLTRNGMALAGSHPTIWSMLKARGLATHAIGKLHYQPLLAPRVYNMPESLVFWNPGSTTGWSGPYYGFDEVELVLGEANESTKAGHYAQWLHRNHPESVRLYEPQASSPSSRASDLKEIWSKRHSRAPSLHQLDCRSRGRSGREKREWGGLLPVCLVSRPASSVLPASTLLRHVRPGIGTGAHRGSGRTRPDAGLSPGQ